MPLRTFAVLAAGSAALGFAASTPAAAEIVKRADAKNRPITFDIQMAGVDVDGFARLLSESLHGDEIGSVVVRVIAESAIAGECGADAAACYRRVGADARIIVPAVSVSAVRDSLVHEYGHHVDSSVRHQAGRCSDGTAQWWAARKAASLVASGELRCDYSAGWNRSVAEVFAEDYRVLNTPGAVSRGFSGQPGPAVLDALRADLAALDGAAPPPPAQPPATPADPTTTPAGGTSPPLIPRGRGLSRGGRLPAGGVATTRFGLAGSQRVAITVRRRGGTRADFAVVLRCGSGPRLVGDGRRRPSVLVRGRVGPGLCTVTVRAGRRPLDFGLTVRVPV